MTRHVAWSLALTGLLAAGCVSDPWTIYDSSLYTTLREPSPETYAAHLDLLLLLVDRREAQGQAPPPGICAESAFYLHRAGRTSEASAYLAREKRYYPESGLVVAALGRLIAGERAIPNGDGEHEEKTP